MKPHALVVAVALLACAAAAGAQECSNLSGPDYGELVYARVPDTQVPALKSIARALRDNTRRVTVLWQTGSSCSNRAAAASGATTTDSFSYVPSSSEDPGWTPGAAALNCIVTVPVALSVFGYALDDSCEAAPLPTGIATQRGSVVPYVFAVPQASDETAITAEEAYFVFGFGADGGITPWTDPTQLFVRTPVRDIMAALGSIIRVPKTQWHGVAYDSASQVVAALQTTASPDKAIGIVDGPVIASTLATSKPLAFRAFEQRKAYYPSATRTGHDLRNVRDGHYVPWTAVTWAHATNTPAAQVVVDALAGKTGAFNFDALARVATAGVVPWCAMEVTRSSDGGPLSRIDVPESCACAFDALVGTSTCATCSESNLCATGVCRRGYCEAR